MKDDYVDEKKDTRLSLTLSPVDKEWLKYLLDHTKAASWSEVIRKSLELYRMFVDHRLLDGKVIFRAQNGTEETLRIL